MAEADLREIKQYLTQHLLQQWEQHLIEKVEQKYAPVQHIGDGISNSNMALFIEQMNKRFAEQRENNDKRVAEQREDNNRRFADLIAYSNKRFEDTNRNIERNGNRITLFGILIIGWVTAGIALLGVLIQRLPPVQ